MGFWHAWITCLIFLKTATLLIYRCKRCILADALLCTKYPPSMVRGFCQKYLNDMSCKMFIPHSKLHTKMFITHIHVPSHKNYYFFWCFFRLTENEVMPKGVRESIGAPDGMCCPEKTCSRAAVKLPWSYGIDCSSGNTGIVDST